MTLLTQRSVNALLVSENSVSRHGLKEFSFTYFTDKETELKNRKLHLHRAVLVKLQTDPKCATFEIRFIFGTAVSFQLTR